jgi:hypothetical protein
VTSARIFRPRYTIDLTGVRIDESSGDYVTGDSAELMMLARVNAEAIALYRLAGSPACIGYVTTSAHLRVLDAHFRLAGTNSRFVESHSPDEARVAYDALLCGRLTLVIARSPYIAGPAIPTAVMLVRPVRSKEAASAFLSRLQPSSSGGIVVVDLADVTRQHGIPENWQADVIIGEPQDCLRLPMLDRLSTMSASQIQGWAEGSYDRLELGRIARGFKSGWSQHSQRGWLDKQVKARGSPVRPGGTPRPPRGDNS